MVGERWNCCHDTSSKALRDSGRHGLRDQLLIDCHGNRRGGVWWGGGGREEGGRSHTLAVVRGDACELGGG